jgi:hypothetical protein
MKTMLKNNAPTNSITRDEKKIYLINLTIPEIESVFTDD